MIGLTSNVAINRMTRPQFKVFKPHSRFLPSRMAGIDSVLAMTYADPRTRPPIISTFPAPRLPPSHLLVLPDPNLFLTRIEEKEKGARHTDIMQIIENEIDNQLFRSMETYTSYHRDYARGEKDKIKGGPDEEEFSVWVVLYTLQLQCEVGGHCAT